MKTRLSTPRLILLAVGSHGLAACNPSSVILHGNPSPRPLPLNPNGSLEGIHKIKHVIVVMQENRSFDSYFGTYPGADGLAISAGKATNCIPNPRTGGQACSFHDSHDVNGGGPHGQDSADADIAGGAMNGFG